MKLNLATILAILGGLGVFAPDVAGLATWLASMNISWLSYVVRGLGLLAAFFAAAPLVVPRLRSFLALLGLATPPGAVAPWDPKRDVPPAGSPVVVGNGPGQLQAPPSNVVSLSQQTPPRRTGPGSSNLGILVFLGASLLATASCAWWQKHGPQVECAAMATVENAPQLVVIIEGCAAIVVTPAAIPACVSAAAASQWTSDILACFEDAAQGKVSCPAFVKGQAQLKAMRASAGGK